MKQLTLVGVAVLTAIGLSACGSTEKSEMAKKIEANQVCEYIRPTGSKIKKKICMTREQKAKQDELARSEMNKVQRRMAHESNSRCSGGGC